MWALAVAIYCGCKWLTWRRTPVHDVPTWKHAAYLFGWPGMDAATFLQASAERPPHQADWVRGLRNLAIGLLLFFGVARFIAPHWPYLAAWIGMAGVALTLHFGLLHVLSCVWRRLGMDARPLMNTPIISTSLGEFWGRRWNTAFRDLTHRFLFRPLTRRLGVRAGIAGGFVFSGLMHELVISVPAGGGYGGPTLFFAAQGIGILVERSRVGRQSGLTRPGRGWLFTMLMLVLPAPVLFHSAFVQRIVIPFMHASGAL
jgi:D-alanyl-lipoteichoic acid acyltransferase DltB (MBOAT superfamily)